MIITNESSKFFPNKVDLNLYPNADGECLFAAVAIAMSPFSPLMIPEKFKYFSDCENGKDTWPLVLLKELKVMAYH